MGTNGCEDMQQGKEGESTAADASKLHVKSLQAGTEVVDATVDAIREKGKHVVESSNEGQASSVERYKFLKQNILLRYADLSERIDNTWLSCTKEDVPDSEFYDYMEIALDTFLRKVFSPMRLEYLKEDPSFVQDQKEQSIDDVQAFFNWGCDSHIIHGESLNYILEIQKAKAKFYGNNNCLTLEAIFCKRSNKGFKMWKCRWGKEIHENYNRSRFLSY